MIFTFTEILDHYTMKAYPYENQRQILNIKYNDLFGCNYEQETKLYVIRCKEKNYTNYKINKAPLHAVEKCAFSQKIQNKNRVFSFLEELGIDEKAYCIIYDYDNMVCATNLAEDNLYVRLENSKIYIVLFTEEQYNFIRLAYSFEDSDYESRYLHLDFDIKLDDKIVDDF